MDRARVWVAITAIGEALNTTAETGLLMAAPVDLLLLPSSISSLESDNKQHRRRLAAPYSSDGGHGADACTRADDPKLSSALSQPEFQTVVTTNRPTLLELLDRTMYKVLPKMSQDKVDMHLRQLSATDLRAMKQFATEASHLVVRLTPDVYCVKQKGMYGRLQAVEAREGMEVIKLWVRGGSYSQEELRQMKKIKIMR